LHREAPFTDVHVHPSLKAYLFRRNLWRHLWSGKTFDPFASRSDFRMLEKGGVGVIWAAHYLPERQLFEDCLLLRLAASLLVPAWDRLVKGSLFERLLEMMDALEREIGRRPDRVELAYSAADVERIRAAGKLAVVHTIEGAHVLEGDPDRLDELAGRGVAMLTLAHFYPNGAVAHVDGIPKDMFVRKLCEFRVGAGGSPPLTDFGRALLDRMGSLPMIVDVSHCTPEARAAVYAELAAERPIVASHVGVARLNPDPYNLSDDEIREVARRGGAVGVIFMTYWLDASHPKNGLQALWKTIEHIHEVTASWDHIVLATDFDGFTDPPDDLRDASQVGRVTGMLLDRGVPEEDVRKILGANAQRVLRTGWR
jgi:microsomal dipeptidase-like Zn-dependent dipeptidase